MYELMQTSNGRRITACLSSHTKKAAAVQTNLSNLQKSLTLARRNNNSENMINERAVKKHNFFTASFQGIGKKRCRTDKLSKSKALNLVLLARRRTKVRRVAKFVRSIKHNFFFNFRFFRVFKGFYKLNLPAEPFAIYCFIRSALFYRPFSVIIELLLILCLPFFLKQARMHRLCHPN